MHRAGLEVILVRYQFSYALRAQFAYKFVRLDIDNLPTTVNTKVLRPCPKASWRLSVIVSFVHQRRENSFVAFLVGSAGP